MFLFCLVTAGGLIAFGCSPGGTPVSTDGDDKKHIERAPVPDVNPQVRLTRSGKLPTKEQGPRSIKQKVLALDRQK
jgi:hypothetical protein